MPYALVRSWFSHKPKVGRDRAEEIDNNSGVGLMCYEFLNCVGSNPPMGEGGFLRSLTESPFPKLSN
jgi:hypothetical protein